MDAKKLLDGLQGFKLVCQNEGYITGDLVVDEIYPEMKPAAFVVKMSGIKTWIKPLSSCRRLRYVQALDVLTGVFVQTTTAKIRKSIHLLVVEDSGQKGDSKLYVINPDLTAKQIKDLYYGKNFYIRRSIRKHLKTGRLNVQQICGLFNIDDKRNIINSLMKRAKADESFKNFLFLFSCSKSAFGSNAI